MKIIQVGTALVEKEGKILIAQRKKDDIHKGKWEFPGGKLEPDESFEECLKRELKEELDLEIEVLDFYCISEYVYSHISVCLNVYKARYVSGEILLNDHSEAHWVSISELGGFEYPEADIPIIKKLIADATIVQT